MKKRGSDHFNLNKQRFEIRISAELMQNGGWYLPKPVGEKNEANIPLFEPFHDNFN